MILMNALKSLRQTADSKYCSVDDSRSFFTYYCCHSAIGPMSWLWKGSHGLMFCLRSSGVIIPDSDMDIEAGAQTKNVLTPLKPGALLF